METIEPLLLNTNRAAIDLRQVPDQVLIKTLGEIADAIEVRCEEILSANANDLSRQDQDNPRNDRLLLNRERIKNIADSIRTISRLSNPSGNILEKRTLPNGLQLEKKTVPLGTVGAIYESRPNVTFDIAALCLRSQNGCVLKGSSDAESTNLVAVHIIHSVLMNNKINPACVTLLPASREVVQQLFTATKYIDVLIPRGSDQLIQFVRKHSMVPVIETGAGVCHVYIHREADLQKAINIAVNAKVSRPSVCNSVDTIIVDKAVAAAFLEQLKESFERYKVEIFADRQSYDLLKNYPYLKHATAEDFGREFLSLKCAVKSVSGIDEALDHIREYSTKHSEAIVSENTAVCERFLNEVDAAAVYANASTRFTDGQEFGLGAEIGISTQKLHARGPFALEKLVTEKWIIRGTGQVR